MNIATQKLLLVLAVLCLGANLESVVGDEVRSEKQNNKTNPVELLNVLTIGGDQLDQSGLTNRLDSDSVNNMLGGFSAVAYDSKNNEFLFLSDRGPKDGAVDWTCRLQAFSLELPSDAAGKASLKLSGTTVFKNKDGLPMTGLAEAFEASDKKSQRLDPEGIRISKNGNLFITDEYGPRMIEFERNGKFVREFEMPSHLLIENPGLTKPDENPKNTSGRATNRGMEGLAISEDGQSLFGLMQSPLLQDSNRKNPAKPSGLNCRMQEFTAQGDFVREFVYQLDSKSNKLNEVLACDSGAFVVIERDGEIGEEAEFKKLMLVSTESATDVKGRKSLPAKKLPGEIAPVEKRVLIDLLDPKWGLAGSSMPEKIEGLAFGADLADGRKTLMVVSDNDFDAKMPTCIYLFAIDPSHLDW